MPSHLFADRPAPQPPERGSVDALISQTRRLRGDVDAVRRDTVAGDDEDPQGRWQRALCELAVHQLDDLGAHLGQLKAGLPARTGEAPAGRPPAASGTSLLCRAGSAEWDLLTDEAHWSDELYEIFGRAPESGPLTLDELPSMLLPEDQGLLASMVTDCLVDGKPIDGEFRIVRTDDVVRTLHMLGEPVLDSDGCTASMWAVLRDVSELRRSQRAVSETRDSLRHQQHIARTERRLAVELQESVLPPWRGPLRLPHGGPAALDLAAHYLPSSSSAMIGGDWYDALELPDGQTLLTVGDLTGHGVAATSGMAMLLGAVRGMAMAGIAPGDLMGHLNHLLETSTQPALGSAMCCRYDPVTRLLTWAQAGHPAPLLFRDGTGRALTPPEGVLLGATSGAAYEQAEVQLRAGDLLVLHTDGISRRTPTDDAGPSRLLDLAPRFAEARSAQECVRLAVEEFGEAERENDACVLIARIAA
ncbi:phosphatase [Streptomyces agglomeratus]|uniref:PP2C family protein-serine/threonine phosphatase n=1 Tax=Streptomyces agglomeratus TaxID=285458 RepID=UPI0008524BC4|nr:SpoIIE family protein phosphatase [Streptomyces agglomeratus]OEJ50094.1 phosphatase [Streptomyces agglomeratus]OEJ57420.1 phosphatase [Streptomyces agglomeratus]